MSEPLTRKQVGDIPSLLLLAREYGGTGLDRPFKIIAEIDQAQRDTIAALQQRVEELDKWKRIVEGTGTDREAVIRMAAAEYTKAAVQCWKEKVAQLEQQLAAREAELHERDAVASWYEALVSRACIGTKATPSLRAYIEQLEAELAQTRRKHDANQ